MGAKRVCIENSLFSAFPGAHWRHFLFNNTQTLVQSEILAKELNIKHLKRTTRTQKAAQSKCEFSVSGVRGVRREDVLGQNEFSRDT